MRYFLGFLAAIGLIVLVFILILRGFSGNSNSPKRVAPLSDYATTNTVVQLTIDGPVVAEDLHRGVRITVGGSENRLEIYQGYQNNVIQSKTYANNEQAYGVFLRALQLASFNKGNAEGPADERGVCATGSRYIYEIIDGNTDVQRYWSTSCGGQGNFQGSPAPIRNLFSKQIPDYGPILSAYKVSFF
ncbi:MAG TPA: hypothetical protein VMY99_00440 [Nevskiaceae bacterium]|nr:hypothetical protein [Nevskiaceae bacterium]